MHSPFWGTSTQLAPSSLNSCSTGRVSTTYAITPQAECCCRLDSCGVHSMWLAPVQLDLLQHCVCQRVSAAPCRQAGEDYQEMLSSWAPPVLWKQHVAAAISNSSTAAPGGAAHQAVQLALIQGPRASSLHVSRANAVTSLAHPRIQQAQACRLTFTTSSRRLCWSRKKMSLSTYFLQLQQSFACLLTENQPFTSTPGRHKAGKQADLHKVLQAPVLQQEEGVAVHVHQEVVALQQLPYHQQLVPACGSLA